MNLYFSIVAKAWCTLLDGEGVEGTGDGGQERESGDREGKEKKRTGGG